MPSQDAPCSRSIKRQGCDRPDGHYIQGAQLWPDGNKGCLAQQDPVAQIRPSRDDC